MRTESESTRLLPGVSVNESKADDSSLAFRKYSRADSRLKSKLHNVNSSFPSPVGRPGQQLVMINPPFVIGAPMTCSGAVLPLTIAEIAITDGGG